MTPPSMKFQDDDEWSVTDLSNENISLCISSHEDEESK